MKAYFGGQIKEAFRGEFALVVTAGDNPNEHYRHIVCTSQEEFIDLTGTGTRTHPLERAYIGISSAISEHGLLNLIPKHCSPEEFEEALKRADKYAVMPEFLREEAKD